MAKDKTKLIPDNKRKIAEQANQACHMPANKNGPDLNKGGKKGGEGASDFA